MPSPSSRHDGTFSHAWACQEGSTRQACDSDPQHRPHESGSRGMTRELKEGCLPAEGNTVCGSHCRAGTYRYKFWVN